ncbi:hypothetical protein [Mangrovibacter phragmitis]|nr:hypothetical protein [Mangrovibacter phragmitis]
MINFMAARIRWSACIRGQENEVLLAKGQHPKARQYITIIVKLRT